MLKSFKQNTTQEIMLYNNILLLSRNKIFYTKFNLTDTFQNRIHLIFMHISFLFIKIKQKNKKKIYEVFFQKVFDLMFVKIELNMREIGYGDVGTNKNMKSLVKIFNNILIYCENYKGKNLNLKKIFFSKYLGSNIYQKSSNNVGLIEYFDKYQAFCFDLNPDSVLKGDVKFNYK